MQKDVGVAYILLIFLGLIGIHNFYLGKIGKGMLYLFLSFTGITIILCIIDLFTLGNQVKKHNMEVLRNERFWVLYLWKKGKSPVGQ